MEAHEETNPSMLGICSCYQTYSFNSYKPGAVAAYSTCLAAGDEIAAAGRPTAVDVTRTPPALLAMGLLMLGDRHWFGLRSHYSILRGRKLPPMFFVSPTTELAIESNAQPTQQQLVQAICRLL